MILSGDCARLKIKVYWDNWLEPCHHLCQVIFSWSSQAEIEQACQSEIQRWAHLFLSKMLKRALKVNYCTNRKAVLYFVCIQRLLVTFTLILELMSEQRLLGSHGVESNLIVVLVSVLPEAVEAIFLIIRLGCTHTPDDTRCHHKCRHGCCWKDRENCWVYLQHTTLRVATITCLLPKSTNQYDRSCSLNHNIQASTTGF